MLGSHGCFAMASASAWSLRPGFFHPLLELDDFDRVCGSSQRLRQKRIRIKSDRRDKRIQLIVRNLRCGFLRFGIRSNLSGFGGGEFGPTFLVRPARSERRLRLRLWNKLTG